MISINNKTWQNQDTKENNNNHNKNSQKKRKKKKEKKEKKKSHEKEPDTVTGPWEEKKNAYVKHGV